MKISKLLRNKDFDNIRKDLKKYPLGFGLDKEIDLNNENSIRKTLEKVGVTEDYVLVWGTGEVYREFLHVDDLADACVFLMEKIDAEDLLTLTLSPSHSKSSFTLTPSLDYFVNVGTGEDIKLKDLIKLIKNIVSFEGEIKHDTSKPDGTPRKLLDISRIKELGWKPKITLQEGIKKTYEWYTDH